MSDAVFGPEYPKIQTVFKRTDKGVIVLDDFTCPEFEYLLDCPWRWTEKIDGTNIRVHLDPARDEGVVFGGRTANAQIPAYLVTALDEYGLKDEKKWTEVFNIEDDPCQVTIFGEGYGAKIQKGGGNYRPDQGFIVFDVKVGRWWLKPEDVKDVATKFGLDVVPELALSEFTLRQVISAMRLAVGHDDLGFVSAWPGVDIEGIVGTPAVDLFDRRGDRIITKLKVKDFERLERA